VNKRLKLELELMSESVDQFRRDMNKLSDNICKNVFAKLSCEEEKKEVNKILEYVEHWESRIEDVAEEVLRESKDVKEGLLSFDEDNGKFSVDCGRFSRQLSCGSRVELYLYDGFDCVYLWMRGCVEHSTTLGYYFSSIETEKVALRVGQRARIRL